MCPTCDALSPGLAGEEAEDGVSKGANSVGPTGPASGSSASKNWLDLQEVV